MTLEDTERFYKKDLYSLKKRLIKGGSPLIKAISLVFFLMSAFFSGLDFLVASRTDHFFMVIPILVSTLFSAFLILCNHLILLRRQRQFNPVQIQVSPHHPPYDK